MKSTLVPAGSGWQRGWVFTIRCWIGLVAALDAGAAEWFDPAGPPHAIVIVGDDDVPAAVVAEIDRLKAATVRVSSQVKAPEHLPGFVAAAGSSEPRGHDALVAAVTAAPEFVGIGLAGDAALAVQGRILHSIGKGRVRFILAASAGRPLREIVLQSGEKHDLTLLRRAALERAAGGFPPRVAPEPRVECGALVIVGGGRMGPEITDKFIELAGGPAAPIVVLPIAAGDELPEDVSGDTRALARAGATNVRSLRARTRAEVESPEFTAAIHAARGVWFNGGRQWRFVDAYQGTAAEDLLRGVLRRGGVIGGSSAGASIQSQYLPRGSPLGNEDMMAEGYERGLGFLPGTAIDQHFSERSRHGDMTRLMRRYPQLLGIGIDEGTALIVKGQTAHVIGRGQAFFYDYREGRPAGERDYAAVPAGSQFDLVQRRIAR